MVVSTGGAVLPLMHADIIPQVLAFPSLLDGTKATSIVLVVQALGAYPTITMDPRIDEASGTYFFTHLILGSMITVLHKRY